MKFLHLVFILVLFTLSYSAKSQSAKFPSAKAKKQAQNHKLQYPEHSIISIESKDIYQFEYDSNSGNVMAYETNTKNYMALEDEVIYRPYKFYDDMSLVESVSASYNNKRSVPISIQNEKYVSEEFFHTDTKIKYFNLSFPYTGFQYSTKFKKKYHDIKYLTTAYFHNDHPSCKHTIEFHIPDWLYLEFKEFNFENYDVIKKEVRNIKNETRKITYTIYGIDSRTLEENAPGPSYIYPHLLLHAKRIDIKGNKRNLFNSIQDLYEWYKSLIDALDEQPQVYAQLANQLTPETNSEVDQIKSIYYWIQDNIRYIAFENGIAGFKPDESQNVFIKRYGDCKGMANLLKQMLKQSGLDARLAWLGTKYLNYDYSTPSLSSDNHMICVVFTKDHVYYLDPTDRFSSLGELSDRIQGKQALIENKESYIINDIPTLSEHSNVDTIISDFVLIGDHLHGSVHRSFSGESKTEILTILNQIQQENISEYLINYLSNGVNHKDIYNLSYQNHKKRDGSYSIDYSAKIEGEVDAYENEYYINLNLFSEELNTVDSSRTIDLVLAYKSKLISITNFKVPDNFEIHSIPKVFESSSNYLSIKASYNIENNRVVYTKEIQIPNSTIAINAFKYYNNQINKFHQFSTEPLILKKR